jgi:hypothetical protein
MERILAALIFVSVFAGSVRAEEKTKPEKEMPQYEWSDPELVVTVQDASLLWKWFRENAFMRDVRDSNLGTGLSQRSGMLFKTLFELPTNDRDSMLVNSLGKIFLSGRRAGVAYYRRGNLRSPFGVFFHSDGFAAKHLDKIMTALKKHGVVEDSANKVHSLKVMGQRLALAWQDKCFSISRDPEVTRATLLVCQNEKLSRFDRPLTVRFDLLQLAPEIYAAANSLSGIERALEFHFRWDETKKAMLPVDGSIKRSVASKDYFVARPWKAELWKMVPAEATVVVGLTMPLPIFSVSELSKWFVLTPEKRNQSPQTDVIFLSLGPSSADGWIPLSGLVIPKRKGDVLEKVTEVYNYTKYDEVYVNEVCGCFVLSQNVKFADRIRLTCEGKVPLLTQHGVPSLAKRNVSSVGEVYVSLSRMASTLTETAMNQGDKSIKEYEQTLALYEKLPSFFYTISADAQKLNFVGEMK